MPPRRCHVLEEELTMAAATTNGTWRERHDSEQSNDAIDLMRFWREHEAAIGIRSNFGSMLAALEGMAAGSGPPAGWDPHSERIEEIGRCRRTWQVLRAMDARGQTVEIVALHRLYGDVMCPVGYRGTFGDLAPLVSLTDAASAARDRLAADAGAEREEAVIEPASRAMAHGRARIEGDIESAVEAANRVVDQIDKLGVLIGRDQARASKSPDEPLSPVAAGRPRRHADLTRRLAGWDAHIAILQGAVTCDGVLRARHGALASADHEITVDDAIQQTLRQTARDVAARSAFVVAVSMDAKALKVRAHEAYRAAKHSVGWRTLGPIVGPVATSGAQGYAEPLEARARGSGWSST
jgi:hypothetical protein